MRGELRGRRRPPANPEPLDLAGVQIPYHFRCPISLELMRDPVTVSTGQTYDRRSIESWLSTGNTTCPVARSPLADFTLIPNHTVRRLIQEWCVAHRSDGVERIPTPKQPADPAAVRFLLARAAADDRTAETRLAALHGLRSLAIESEKNRAVISTHETRAILIEIAFGRDLEVAAAAMETMAMLPATDAESCAVAARPERVARLAEVLAGDRWLIEARIGAAAVVEGLRTAESREVVGAAPGVIEGLIELVNEKGNLMAVRVGIRGSEALQREAVAAGVVAQLLMMVQGGCSERARRKAQMLLKLLRPAWPEQDSFDNSDGFLQHY